MASHADPQDQSSNKEAVARQTPPNNHPQMPPHATGYYPATGYPPPMGYPPGQPGYPPPGYHYPGYANPGYPNYAYSQAPPAAYYNNHMYQPPQQESYNPAGFARGFMLGLFLLVFFLFTVNITMWLIVRPELPVYHLDSLTVSNFKASWPTLTGDWEANITVKNPNSKLKLSTDQIQNMILYGDEDHLATSFSRPISLDTHTTYQYNIKLSANTTDALMAGKFVVDQMAEQRSKGSVSFNLRMVYWTTFRTGSWYAKKVILRVYCDHVKVGFVGATGNGNAFPDSLRDCLIIS